MPSQRIRLRNILFGIVVVGILSTLLSPVICPPHCSKGNRCAGNLRQLYQLGTVYASAHKGEWPREKGSALWLSFSKSSPPLLERDHLEMLGCPVRGEWEPGQCDYIGPRKPISELRPGEALGACKPGNHGEATSGNVLLKDGSVVEYDFSDPVWDTLTP